MLPYRAGSWAYRCAECAARHRHGWAFERIRSSLPSICQVWIQQLWPSRFPDAPNLTLLVAHEVLVDAGARVLQVDVRGRTATSQPGAMHLTWTHNTPTL
jgi:hypothetical protein